jgi:glycogen phosphorylase
MDDHRRVAYFSMEIGLKPSMPTYSGGLGVLAGDTIRSAADLSVPMVAISLLHRKGYFYQRIDDEGWQKEEPTAWVVDDFLLAMPPRVTVDIEGRTVHIRAWKHDVTGIGGFEVPVYLLDTSLEENSDWDAQLTDSLYGGDSWYRLCQEIILGIGGVRMLRALGYTGIQRYHMNEGHASLLTLELLDEELRKAGRTSITQTEIETVRRKCVFTTHTPVPAGHDQFPLPLVERALEHRQHIFENREIFCFDDVLNMTYLALGLSHYVNGVAKKHGEVSRHMFANYSIDSITNGVHAATWVAQPFQVLFDRYIPGWREDNFSLRYALSIPGSEMSEARNRVKAQLLQYVNQQTNAGMDRDIFTIGFARRVATYKRADILLTDIERLKRIAAHAGAFQVIYAGKAHPHDDAGKAIIQRIIQASATLRSVVKIVYLPNYDMSLGQLLTSGVDLWLNTPRSPMEASGTSGMKAAMNGVPSLSVMDGWWIEGCIRGVTGWPIDEEAGEQSGSDDRTMAARSLYDTLEREILPLFYHDHERWVTIMRHAIALNGSFFNTQRMLQQYVLRAYFR